MADQNKIKEVLESNKLERNFSRVIISLENLTIPEEKLHITPSSQDGLSHDQEFDLRVYGCELIQTSGILLDLPQVAMATGQVLFQRFFYCKSFVKFNVEVLSMACINLASKIEEAPRRIRDVINVYHHIKQVRNNKTITPMVLDNSYINLKSQVIRAERRVLKELGFCVHVKHAHKMIFMYLHILDCEKNKRLLQCAWNYMNDSFRTNVFVRFQPEVIACACIYLASSKLEIPLPDNPAWWLLFGAEECQIKEISVSILKLYNRKKINLEEIEKTISNIKSLQQANKLKDKFDFQFKSELKSLNSTPETSKPSSPTLKNNKSNKDNNNNNNNNININNNGNSGNENNNNINNNNSNNDNNNNNNNINNNNNNSDFGLDKPTLTLGEEINKLSRKKSFANHKERERSRSRSKDRSRSNSRHHRHHKSRHRYEEKERERERYKKTGDISNHSNSSSVINLKEKDVNYVRSSSAVKLSHFDENVSITFVENESRDGEEKYSKNNKRYYGNEEDEDYKNDKKKKKRSRLTPSPIRFPGEKNEQYEKTKVISGKNKY